MHGAWQKIEPMQERIMRYLFGSEDWSVVWSIPWPIIGFFVVLALIAWFCASLGSDTEPNMKDLFRDQL